MDEELLKLYEEYKEKVIVLNSSIWTTLINLHGIIISAFAILLAIATTKFITITFILFTITLTLSLLSILAMLQNLNTYRNKYLVLAENIHPKNIKNNEALQNLKKEQQKTDSDRLKTRRYETFAKCSAILTM